LVREVVAAAAVVAGLFFMFVASLGLLRLPDFYLRVHAPTKAATLGLFALMAGLVIATRPEVRLSTALLAALFVGATIPIGAHILTRGAYRSGVRPRGKHLDEYAPLAAEEQTGNGNGGSMGSGNDAADQTRTPRR
jgi:multicomponent Na+:H+ antiporter subunit G